MTTLRLRRLIASLKKHQLFCTLEVVNLGPRTAVDKALQRMVTNRVIIRAADGVFFRNDQDGWMPTPEQVALKKASVYGKRLFPDAQDLAYRLKLSDHPNPEHVFNTDGASSSFRCGEIRIKFKKISSRKVALTGSQPGALIRALWHLGLQRLDASRIFAAINQLNLEQRQILFDDKSAMPGWLGRLFTFIFRFPPDVRFRPELATSSF